MLSIVTTITYLNIYIFYTLVYTLAKISLNIRTQNKNYILRTKLIITFKSIDHCIENNRQNYLCMSIYSLYITQRRAIYNEK